MIEIHYTKLRSNFVTPPENQDMGILEISYAITDDYILQLVLNKDTFKSIIFAYKHPKDNSKFEPEKNEPYFGEYVGQAKINYLD